KLSIFSKAAGGIPKNASYEIHAIGASGQCEFGLVTILLWQRINGILVHVRRITYDAVIPLLWRNAVPQITLHSAYAVMHPVQGDIRAGDFQGFGRNVDRIHLCITEGIGRQNGETARTGT